MVAKLCQFLHMTAYVCLIITVIAKVYFFQVLVKQCFFLEALWQHPDSHNLPPYFSYQLGDFDNISGSLDHRLALCTKN